MRNFPTVKTYLVANGAVLFSKPMLTKTKQQSRFSNLTLFEQKSEKRIAEVIAVLFFGGEKNFKCEYLKSVKQSKRGRFRVDEDCSLNPVVDSGYGGQRWLEDWFECPFEYNQNGSQQGIDFKALFVSWHMYVMGS